MSLGVPARRLVLPGPIAAGLGAGIATLAGLAVYEPTIPVLAPLALVAGLGVAAFAIRAPRMVLGILIATTMIQIVYVVTDSRAVNAFDLLMPILLGWTIFARRDLMTLRPRPHDMLSADAVVLDSAQRLLRAVIVYFSAAVLSLLILWHDFGLARAVDSGLILARAIQGILLFALGAAWLRTRREVDGALSAFFVGGVVFVLVNAVAVLFWGVRRAGLTWILNLPDWPITSPNEAAVAALMLGVVLLVRQANRPQLRNQILFAALLVMLIMTLSRSGLLAWITFGVFFLPRVNWRSFVPVLLAGVVALPLVPEEYWGRLVRTVAVERGSFEAFTVIGRFYAWATAVTAVLERPLTGYGYLAFRYISHQFNDLKFVIGQVENYYLEMAVSMGLIGLALLIAAIIQLYRLGIDIGRRVPAASLSGRMSRYHVPLVTALMVGNVTGDNFVSMVLLAQIAIWCAILVRAAQADLWDGSR